MSESNTTPRIVLAETPVEKRYRKALEKISEGRGRFSMDYLQHAKNTIEDAIDTAKKALAGEELEDD